MQTPDFAQFERLAQPGTVVPICRELLADMETPVSVFRKLDQASPHAFMLESVEGGETIGRYTFLGADPHVILKAWGSKQELVSRDKTLKTGRTPIETLRMLLARYCPVEIPGLPPLAGGMVGYLSYDGVRYFEEIPDKNPDHLGLPDCFVMLAENIVAFDHVRHRMVLVSVARVDGSTPLEEVYRGTTGKLDELRDRVLGPVPAERSGTANNTPAHPAGPAPSADYHPVEPGAFAPIEVPVEANCPRDVYLQGVERAKEYITAGDIFQVVLSQRFRTPLACHPFDIYRALRAINPSPYMFYLKCGEEFQLAGSSPELLARLDSKTGRVTVRPIAGTRARGATPAEDEALEQDLLGDEKERAEHVMLVDLGRNDVGRVCRFGTVRVSDFMTIERYSHVMHIVSNVEGSIAERRDGLDVMAAAFPAGTLSGAPKIRAMEIIDELEVSRRGPYGGSVVYLSFNGAMDSCITIRTAVISGGHVYIQAGGGIVADSVPENEYMECVNKAKGLLRAVEMAGTGLE